MLKQVQHDIMLYEVHLNAKPIPGKTPLPDNYREEFRGGSGITICSTCQVASRHSITDLTGFASATTLPTPVTLNLFQGLKRHRHFLYPLNSDGVSDYAVGAGGAW